MTLAKGHRWFEVCDLATPDENAHPYFIRLLKPWEREVIALISEQGAIRLDQLARFTGHDPSVMERIASDFVEERFVECKEILFGDPAWVWLTPQANRASGTGLWPYVPAPSALNRLYATNEIRLHLTAAAPEGRWVSKRFLQQGSARGSSTPIAEFVIGAERHAIELRLTTNNADHLVEVLNHRNRNYVLVACFCTSRAVKFVKRLKERYGWSRVVVYELPRLP